MKITHIGKQITDFEYYEPEAGTMIQAHALAYGGQVEIISEGMTYTLSLDDVGALVVRVYGRGFESLNISPRSGNEVRLWCETWKPQA